MSGVDLHELVEHLAEETAALTAALGVAGEGAFGLLTPSPGWTVADQVSHLAYFDEAATASVADPAAFEAMRAEAYELGASLPDVVAARYRDRTPAELVAWLRASRTAMVDAMLERGPSARVPWYGPDFSVASSLTGRIMETWAHGQDVYDALEVEHPVSAALYDVARLCARTRANSYASRGAALPDEGVAVELTAPDGSTWSFGEGEQRVTGPAVDFCLVGTQRRHPSDTALVATGPLALEWLAIAQAFAGPPGEGRAALGERT